MLLDFYNLKEQPFGVTADPSYLYMGPTHREALASLAYGIQSSRGFMSIIAKPGMGKTTILFQLVDQLKDSARTVYLFQTLCRPQDLLRGLLCDLGVVDNTGDVASMQVQLNHILLAEAHQGRKVILIIDEAQNLEDSSLELVRMLSNFESTSHKLMHIILAGQPQLRDTLASPELLQLRQRISIFARLQPLNAEETHLYIEHRLRVAGYKLQMPLFTPQAEALIAKHSGGIPRNINNICFNALSLAYVQKERSIQKEVVREVLDDLDLDAQGFVERTPERRKFIPSIAIKPKEIFHLAFAWRTRLVLSCVLLLIVTLLSGRKQTPNIVGAASLAATNGTSSPLSASLLNARIDAQNKQRSEPESLPKPSAHGFVRKYQVAGNREPQSHSRTGLSRKSDPTRLWQEVKRRDSDAEVELARMYLEGTAVPQNCAQAQILLLAASQKGNVRATELLNDHSSQCN